MENAGKEDIPEDAERKGLGTPATRAAIIEKLSLRDTMYEDTASYGHFDGTRHSWENASILGNPIREELDKHAN